ncbi:polysaccharide biosynthesis/export family protein [Candidatus Omnitrophota bacterium]
MFFKKIATFTLVLWVAGVIFVPGLKAELYQNDAGSEYLMGPGDTIEISVWNHPELTKTMRVRPDGKISFPLVGDAHAAGITPTMLKERISKRLTKYLKDPEVSVIIMDYKSKSILVMGDVKKPGLYQYEGDMTAFDAIALAGGYGKHAELKSILVIADAYSENPEFYIANLYRAIHDADISENVRLRPRDIVYVPKNFIGNIGDVMDFFFSRIQPAAASYFLLDEATDSD